MTPATADSGGDAYDLFRRGASFLASGHPGQAALLLARAERLEPGKNSIREALGRAYYALGDFERARAKFAAIVADVPTNDYAHFALGMSLVRLGRAQEARGHLKLAQALSPASQRYRVALAGLAASHYVRGA